MSVLETSIRILPVKQIIESSVKAKKSTKIL